MAPRFDNFLDGSVGGLGGAMGNYFKWNFSQSPAGISTYSAGVNAGLKPSTAFGASLLTTAGLQYATNNALKGRDRDQKKPTFGDTYGMEDQIWDSTVGIILPNQGKVPRTYSDYIQTAKKNNATDSQILSESAYNRWKEAEFNQGGVFRINREGEGSEIAGRDTATFFNRTVANPLYAYDGTLGKENVDRLTTGIGLTGLAGSATALKGYTDLAKAGATVGAAPAYTGSQTAKVIGSSIAKGLGTAAFVYSGITDFAESKKAGDSDLRAATNAVSSTAGGLYGASQGALAGSTFGPIGTGVGALVGGLVGSNAGGWLSDRVLDLSEGTGTDAMARRVASRTQAANNSKISYAKTSDKDFLANNNSPSPSNPSVAARAVASGLNFTNMEGDDMAAPKTRSTTVRASDYAAGEKASVDRYKVDSDTKLGRYKVDTDAVVNLRNNALQSSDRRYATDRTADVNLRIGTQRNQVDLAVGLDRNAVTREVGKYTSDNQLRASNFKTYADLQAALNRNTLQSGDNRFETATKYGTQERINAYNRNTLDKTEVATAQIKAGTYGMSKESQAKAANDKINFDNWKRQNDANFDYADRMNAQIRLGQQMRQSETAYSDQRLDRQNDRAAAMHKFQVEQAQRNADRAQQTALQKEAREQQRADFNLRSQQIQSQIDLANRDFSLRSQESAARVADIYGTLGLKNQQFAATRADVGYNRSQQGRSNLAF